MRRLAAIAAIGTLMACGHGGGGSGIAATSVDWGIPFVPSSASRTMVVCLRNVSGGATSATLQGYKPSGALYTGPVTVTLDGDDEHAVSISTALGGDVPAGGFVLVHTAARNVEVAFNVGEPGKSAEESSRAWPLGDLAAPPATTAASVTITTETDLVQLSNATAAPILLTVTAYLEPAANPLDPPTTSTPPAIALAAWETKTLTPDTISGITGFVGALAFTSASPFLAAVEEDLAFDGTPQVTIAPRQMYVTLSQGQVTALPTTYTDFAMVVRNDADATRLVTLQEIRLADGSSLEPTPRSITLAARESRVITTLDPPFDDLFGDATLQPSLLRVWMHIELPADVDLSFRQFDPLTLASNMTVRPHTVGHIFETLEVFPEPVLPSTVRTFFSIVNPTNTEITVTVESLIPQPDGFDAGPVPLATLTVPALNRIEFSPDGVTYLDRDLVAADVVGFRLRSGAPFTALGRRVHQNASGLILMLSPTIIRNFDDAE